MVLLAFTLLRLWDNRPKAVLVDFLGSLLDWRTGKTELIRRKRADRLGKDRKNKRDLTLAPGHMNVVPKQNLISL